MIFGVFYVHDIHRDSGLGAKRTYVKLRRRIPERSAFMSKTRKLAMVGMLSAVAFILMLLEFPIPLMPGFIKMDVSELPALIGAFAMGPIEGVAICLIKNLIKLLKTSSAGVGELANFLLGAVFVFIAGLIYKKMRNRKGAIIASFVGALAMGVLSVPINYFITYPFYTNFMPMEAIIEAYQAIYSGVNSLLECLLVFNMPFTICKGLLDVLITFLVYKRLSPIIKGNAAVEPKMAPRDGVRGSFSARQ